MSGNSGGSHILNWTPDLKRMAADFYKRVCSIDEGYKEILEFDETALERVIEKYGLYRQKLHAITEGRRIDRHKIIAALVLAFTDENNQPFIINKDALAKSPTEEFSSYLMFPNEIYIYEVITVILTNFVLASKKSSEFEFNKYNYLIRFPRKVTCWETGKVEPYENHLIQLLAAMILLKADHLTKCLLIMSHLSFFHEMAYDCAVKGLSETYYDPVSWWEINPRDKRYKADKLDGLYNKHGLNTIFDSRTSEKKSRMERESVGVIFADCDKFKKINDAFGHAIGDKVLEIYSESIKQAIGLMDDDIKDNSFPARWGGDEFVICVFNCSRDEIQNLSAEIDKTLSANKRWDEVRAAVKKDLPPRTISQGLAFKDDCDICLGELVNSADEQMYKEKKKNRGSIFFKIKNQIFRAWGCLVPRRG